MGQTGLADRGVAGRIVHLLAGTGRSARLGRLGRGDGRARRRRGLSAPITTAEDQQRQAKKQRHPTRQTAFDSTFRRRENEKKSSAHGFQNGKVYSRMNAISKFI
jgi:hypothetical protein